MQRREPQGAYERVTTFVSVSIFVLVLASLSISCAGGSGSSGFDLAENAAIETALDEQRCVESEGLTICPAGAATPSAPEATATPIPAAPTPTPTRGSTDFPTGTPATPSGQQTVTATPESTPIPTGTPTPIPSPTADVGMNVDTSFDGTEEAPCIATDTPGVCVLPFTFMPQGFSLDTHYQVAVRSTADDPWELFDAFQISFDTLTSIFQADIRIETAAQAPTTSVLIQTAVLVFVDELPFLPAGEIVERLSESGADFAFVDPEQELQPVIE